MMTYDDGVGIGIDRVDSAGASGVLTQPKFVLTCATKKNAAANGTAGPASPVTRRSRGPPARSTKRRSRWLPEARPRPGCSAGTGRRIGSHLVITVSRLMRDDLIGAYPFLTLTHGHTHVHVGLIVDCQVCKVQD